MTDASRMLLALSVGAVVLCICCIRQFTKGGSYKQRFIEKAKVRDTCAIATLVNGRSATKYNTTGGVSFKGGRPTFTYEYTVKGTTYRRRLVFKSPEVVELNLPSTLIVYYDEKNPAKSICKEEVEQDSTDSLNVILVPLGVVIFVYNLLRLL